MVLSEADLQALLDSPGTFVGKLVREGNWSGLIEVFPVEKALKAVVKGLKNPKTRKSLLSDLSESRIIEILDSASFPIRNELFHILIRQSETVSVSSSVGKTLLSHLSEHSWAGHFMHELYSLQPLEDVRTALCSRFKQKHCGKPTLDLWKRVLKEKNHYSKKDFTSSEFSELDLSYFVDVDLLSHRKSFCSLCISLLSTVLSEFREKKKNYKNFVIRPFVNLVIGLRSIWRRDKELRQGLINTIIECTPHDRFRKTYMNYVVNPGGLWEESFPLSRYVEFGLI
jgi:hypothetical protein